MSKMIYRLHGSTTVVQASAIKSVEDLADAAGFLANHRLYKMSKGPGGVTVENAQAVLSGLIEAAQRFQEEVLDKLNGVDEMNTISRLGEGEVTNPWEFVGK